jgi:hypothetical protein
MKINRVNAMVGFLQRVREQMRQEKLQKKNPVIEFDLDSWADAKKDKHDNYCGTTCCAVGHAALDPYFRKNGLNMFFEHRAYYADDWNSKQVRGVKDLMAADKIIRSDKFNYHFSIRYTDPVTKQIYTEFNGVEKFFEFDHEETTYILFAPDRYPLNNKSIRNVIGRLNYLLKHGESALNEKYR